MKKMAILLGMIILWSAASVPILPESRAPHTETVKIVSGKGYYTLDLTLPVYLKKGSSYEPEDRKIHVEVDPQKEAWLEHSFAEILIAVEITNGHGDITADFRGYLNCTLRDCDLDTRDTELYWDDVGEKRADRAGEPLSKGTSLTVTDDLCLVKITLVDFFCHDHLADVLHLDYESDLECVTVMREITLDVVVNYSPQHARTIQLLTDAAEHTAAGDQHYQTGELEEAHSAYKKAKALYDQLGDTAKAEVLQEKINEAYTKEVSHHLFLAEQFFAEEAFEKALHEFEKAKEIFDILEDDEMSVKMQVMIEKCSSYLKAAQTLEKGVELFNEAEDTPYDKMAIEKYEKAKSFFETAKTEYDTLKDTEKSERCHTWIQQCDTRIDQLVTSTPAEVEPESMWIYYVLGFVIMSGAILVVVLLWQFRLKPAPVSKPAPPESEELKILKHKLATGRITVEEYRELKSILERQ